MRDFLAANGESVVFKEEFYVRRLHRLLTDFIVLMPLKVRLNNLYPVRFFVEINFSLDKNIEIATIMKLT